MQLMGMHERLTLREGEPIVKSVNKRVASCLGFLGVTAYLAFAIVSFTLYRGSFTPVGNWLSDLGNRVLNPSGSLFYRLAGIVGGAALLPFFLLIAAPSSGKKKAGTIVFALIKVFGAAASICFALTGVFSEDMMPMHSWFSIANFAAFGTAVALSAIYNLIERAYPAWLTVVCLAGWIVDVLSWIWNDTRWLEWVVVAFLIAYVACMAALSRRDSIRS